MHLAWPQPDTTAAGVPADWLTWNWRFSSLVASYGSGDQVELSWNHDQQRLALDVSSDNARGNPHSMVC